MCYDCDMVSCRELMVRDEEKDVRGVRLDRVVS